MSRLLEDWCTEFELGDTVSFDHGDSRLTGKVVRVYNTRLHYHVEVNGRRYAVSIEDNPSRSNPA